MPDVPRRRLLQLAGATSFAFVAGNAGLLDGPAAHAAEPQTLVAGGRAKAVVLLPAQASEQLKAAAAELVRVVARGTGVTLPSRTVTSTDDAPSADGTVRICIGFTLPAADPDLAATLAGLDPDGLVIAPYGDTLTLIGPTDWGSRHAVQEFCEQRLAVTWLVPGEVGEQLTTTGTLTGPGGRVTSEPTFTSRVLYPTPSEEWAWKPRTTPLGQWGDKARTHWRTQFHHHLYTMFDSAKFGDPNKPESYHPEWYPVINGVLTIPRPGANAGWHPRLTAPGLVAEAARQIVEYFDTNPDAPSYSLGLADGGGFSDEDLAGAGTSLTGLPDLSPVYWKFVNDVVADVLRQRPALTDKSFGALAYQYVEDPPPFALHPQVVPYLTRDRLVWLDPEGRAEDQTQTLRWRQVARQVGWYDYVYGNPYVIPRVTYALYDQMFDWAAEHGVNGIMAELSHNWGEGAKPWALARKLWRADDSMRDLARRWYGLAAGRGQTALERYFDVWEEIWTERVPQTTFFRAGRHLTYFPFDDMSYLNVVAPSDIQKAERQLDSARRLTQTPAQAAMLSTIAGEFAYTKASALSYPREHPVPTSASAALDLLTNEVNGVAERVAYATSRAPLWDELARQNPRSWRFDAMGAAWSGWNCKTMVSLAEYVTGRRPGHAAVRSRIEQLAAASPSAEAKAWCRHLLMMINDQGHLFGTNLDFGTGDLTGWNVSFNQPVATPASVVNAGDRHALRIMGGYHTGSVGPQANTFDVGEGVWLTRFSYRTLSAGAKGVIVPGIVAKDWAGTTLGYRQDHYFPMTDGRDGWVEARYVDRLPKGTVQVSSAIALAYHAANTELQLSDFEFRYVGDLAVPGEPPAGVTMVEQDGMLLYSPAGAVDDPQAADGRAAAVVGDKETWAIQYHAFALPDDGRQYRVLARIRVELASRPSGDPQVFRLGTYRANPPRATNQNIVLSATPTEYRWISFDGTFTHSTDGLYLYITGLGGSPASRVLVDRLALVPA